MIKSIKTIARIFLLALLTVIVAGVIIKLDYSHALKTANSEDSEKITIVIDEGETVDQILNSLVENGLVQEKWVNYSKLYLKLNNLYSALQAGTYSIPKNLTILEIIETLQSGKNTEVWVTIPEGLRKDEIADTFVENLGNTFSKTVFLDLTEDTTFIETLGLSSELTDLEGYLFPDKYSFYTDVTEKEVIQRMTDNFKTKIGINDSYQTIVLASMVEKEGRTSTDREIIAGVFLKRYEEGWTLGSDVTILYYLKTWDESKITTEDLTDNNPYNTRVNTGFPPTPICNPGLESIEATRNPVTTDYYYFVSDSDGVMHYAKTAAEHQANVNEYTN